VSYGLQHSCVHLAYCLLFRAVEGASIYRLRRVVDGAYGKQEVIFDIGINSRKQNSEAAQSFVYPYSLPAGNYIQFAIQGNNNKFFQRMG
jgi:hypothetical protein